MACTQYIPLMAGQSSMLHAEAILSDMLGQIGYETVGNRIIFTEDITLDGKKAVTIRLVITDISALGDYDPLPLPADLEAQLIQQVYQSFAPTPVDKVVDNYSAGQSNQPPTK